MYLLQPPSITEVHPNPTNTIKNLNMGEKQYKQPEKEFHPPWVWIVSLSDYSTSYFIYKSTLYRAHDTESTSSLAALYNSSRFAHCCLLSINAGSSSNNCESCLPWKACENLWLSKKAITCLGQVMKLPVAKIQNLSSHESNMNAWI